ncbi:unnamed protein product, partial [Penicillium bialowiezense]
SLPASSRPATLFVSSRACIYYTKTLVTSSKQLHICLSLSSPVAAAHHSFTMRDTPSKFIEILDPKDSHLSDSDVRLEDVLADHEAISSRPRSSTVSSTKPMDKSISRENSTSPTPRWKRLSNILVQPRRNS